jgi:GTP cyclohydrolase IA
MTEGKRQRSGSKHVHRSADAAALQAAVKQFLTAAGVDLTDANLKDTPARVAEAWISEFLDGYQKSPSDVLAERFPVGMKGTPGLVVVTSLHFHSMCPHHLLPYWGKAHIAYVADKAVVGFGKLSELLDVFAHRLVLQETLAAQVAGALMDQLRCQGAACVIEAQQTCFTLRGPKQHQSKTHAECLLGVIAHHPWRSELWSRIGSSSSQGNC